MRQPGSPRQNRVDPFSRIVAQPSRGMFTGNRGILHGDNGQLTSRTWRSTTWVTCLLEFKDRRRPVMTPGEYTHLFFLDEATALAAGHRPCFECRRADTIAFCIAIERVSGTRPNAPMMNMMIHAEMVRAIRHNQREKVEAHRLPPGAMIAYGGSAYLVRREGVQRWSFGGYQPLETFPAHHVERLTPRLSIEALTGGYVPKLHGTAIEC